MAAVATATLGVLTIRSILDISSAHTGGVARRTLASLLLLMTLLQLARWVVMLVLAMFENALRHVSQPVGDPHGIRRPRVSILMPAFNEQDTLDQAFRSMLALDYPDVEVVFVDDGSTDRTLEIARGYAGRHGHVRIDVHTKRNGGKWSALNLALRNATGELVLFVDADSHLHPAALRRLHDTLEARGAGAVAGYVRVRNRTSVLNWLQSLEYLTCNGTMRSAQSWTGSVLVVAGPIGLYRRSVLDRVAAEFGTKPPSPDAGPMEGDTFAEDFDLSLAVLSLGESVVYEPGAVSFTRAPVSMSALLNQRYRWTRGSLQVLRKFARRVLDCPSLLSARVLAWLLACYFLDYVVTPLLVVIGLPFMLLHLEAGWGGGAESVALMLGLLLVSELGLALCFASTHDEQRRLAAVLPLRGPYSSLFLMSIFPFVLWDELRGRPMRW
ncbi:MAG: glycosyltransferase family 2 protein [Planctomycetes bacterium]|nr:glycosyltransferase family 2 protein [Planctomycetota bacterium]